MLSTTKWDHPISQHVKFRASKWPTIPTRLTQIKIISFQFIRYHVRWKKFNVKDSKIDFNCKITQFAIFIQNSGKKYIISLYDHYRPQMIKKISHKMKYIVDDFSFFLFYLGTLFYYFPFFTFHSIKNKE